MTAILNFLFRCKHKRIGWPRYDIKRGQRGVYVTCTDCGKEIPYVNDVLIPTKGR